MKQINEFISNLKKGGNIKIIVFMGLAGIFLIMFSELFWSGEKKQKEKYTETESIIGNYENYTHDMENQLKRILEKIDGVGKTEVMVTVVGTEEYIYAEEEKIKKGENDSSEEKQYVIIGSSGDKQALLKKIVSPEISGVVIICEGGDSNIIKERVYNTISAVLNIPSQRIYVTKSND